MKTIKYILIILTMLLFQFNIYSQKQDDDLPSDTTIPTIDILSFAGDSVTKILIGEKLKVHIKNLSDSGVLRIYLKEVWVTSLEPLKDEADLYWFIFKDVIAKGDTLSRIFNPKNKSEIDALLSIRTENGTKKIYENNFKVIFNKEKKSRNWVIGVIIIFLGLLSIFTIFYKKKIILRDHGTSNKFPPFSLARTQMAFWTIIILIAFFVVWWNTGNIISIPGQVLALLGISTGTIVGARLIDNDDIANNKVRHQEKNDSKTFFLNILSDNNGLSIHRFQNVVFTIAIASYFLYQVFNTYKIPELDTNLMILMGISSGTYLAIKKGEN